VDVKRLLGEKKEEILITSSIDILVTFCRLILQDSEIKPFKTSFDGWISIQNKAINTITTILSLYRNIILQNLPLRTQIIQIVFPKQFIQYFI
jgi:hypothetical protein